MNLTQICYGIQNERYLKAGYTREYELELGKEVVGKLVAESESKNTARFSIRINDTEELSWMATLQPAKEESLCQLECSELSWEFQLRIPRKDEGVIISLGEVDAKIVLMKKMTMLGWGTDSFYLKTSDDVEHSWSIAFDTGIAAFIESIFRIIALGLIPMKNENWVLGATVAKRLSHADQQKLLILNATIRMWMLPNDFGSGG